MAWLPLCLGLDGLAASAVEGAFGSGVTGAVNGENILSAA